MKPSSGRRVLSTPPRAGEEAISEFLSSKAPSSRRTYINHYRLFAKYLGSQRRQWKAAFLAFASEPAKRATATYEGYRSWINHRFTSLTAGSHTHGIGTLLAHLKNRGCATWTLPHPMRERARRTIRRCPSDLRARIHAWGRMLRREGLSDTSVTHRVRGLIYFGVFIGFRGTSYTEVTPETIDSWIAALREEKAHDRTIYERVQTLKRFYSWLAARGDLPHNPARRIRWRIRPLPLPRFLKKEDVRKLLRKTTHVRERALLEMLYSTACWLREIKSVVLSDLSRARYAVRFRSRRGVLTRIPLTRSCRSSLKWYLPWREKLCRRIPSADKNALFLSDEGRPLSSAAIGRIMHRASRRVGLKRPAHAGTLRHSRAVHLLDAGCDLLLVQELLGHVLPTQTMRYARTSIEHLRPVYDRTHPRARVRRKR